MNETTAKAERTIHAPIGRVWSALHDQKQLQQFFMGAQVETDWKVGHPIVMKGEFKGRPYEDKGVILRDVPERELSFSHFSPMVGEPDVPESYHVVTFELSPAGNDTHVALLQSNLTGGVRESDEKGRAEYERNWNAVLDGLEKTVAQDTEPMAVEGGP